MPRFPKSWTERKSADPDAIPLCERCAEIQFQDLSSPGTSHSNKVYSLKLSKILKKQNYCAFCTLLLDASCQDENDLFKSEHIREPLAKDERFADRKTFATWLQARPGMIREILEGTVRREDYWPFGYTHDVDEKQGVKAAAEELFTQAELSDVEVVPFRSESNEGTLSKLDPSAALQATSFAMGIADVGSANRAVAGAHTFTSQLAILNAKKPKKMPCWYMLQLYTPSDHKASAISVRIYAHSRALRSPLREISHFSLRLHREVDPTRSSQQIWYGRPLHPQADVPFFRTCLSKCYGSHAGICGARNEGPALAPPDPSRAKFRLIDTFAMRIVEFFGVCPGSPNTDPERPNINDYVALSYVWGDHSLPPHWEEVATPPDHHPPSDPDFYYWNRHTQKTAFKNPTTKKEVSDLRLTERNLSALTKEYGLETRNAKIPLTVSDAIKVVKDLGLRYLWCDRLCIIQEPGSDREHNVTWMGHIYSEALLTIVAADSQSAHAGIQGVNTDRDLRNESIHVRIAKGITLFLPAEIERDYRPWAERAWTFQEQFLSRRLLVFSKGNAIWHCRVGIWREDVNAKDIDAASTELELLSINKITSALKRTATCPGLQSIHPDGSHRLFRTEEFTDYIQMMGNFSRRRITKSADILEAFRGVATVFEKLMGCQLLYGIPLAYTDLALLWQPRKPMKRLIGTENAPAPPSWSPLGWSCRGKDFEESGVCYQIPYDILADEAGIYTRQKRPKEDTMGEERMRPRRNLLYRVTRDGNKCELADVGMLALSGDHEVPPSTPGPYIQPTPAWSSVKDDQLIISTKVAKLTLTTPVTIQSTYTTVGIETYERQIWIGHRPSDALDDKGITMKDGYSIGDPSNAKAEVGIVTMTSNHRIQCPESVEAIILSQAQYLGNERRILDLGYYLYNIMVIQRTRNGVAERIGLGKIWKTAWNRASSRDEVIILQ